MQNIETSVKDNVLTIKVKLNAERTPSSSGKTEVIASTRGNQQVADNVFMGVNVYTYPQGKKSA